MASVPQEKGGMGAMRPAKENKPPGVAELQPSPQLLGYFKRRVDEFEAERTELLKRVDSCAVDKQVRKPALGGLTDLSVEVARFPSAYLCLLSSSLTQVHHFMIFF